MTGFTLSREMIVVKYDVGGKFDLHYDFAMVMIQMFCVIPIFLM